MDLWRKKRVHFRFSFLVMMSSCAVLSHSVVSNSLRPHDCSPPGSSVHGDSPGKNTGVGCHALLQGIFPTQESNLGLLHCRQILYRVRYKGNSKKVIKHMEKKKKEVRVLVTRSCPTLCDPMDCSPPGSSVHGDSPGKNTRVGCHALLQGIFPTQGSNLLL